MTARTHRGRVRRHNEDAVGTDLERRFAVLADGMGGLEHGGLASGEAVACTVAFLVEALTAGAGSGAVLEQALTAASERVRDCARQRSGAGTMGTTLIAMTLDAAHGCVIAHLGDSRAYRFRDGSLERLTHDHSMVEDLLSRGVMDAPSARRSPYRNVITRAIGLEAAVQPELIELPLAPGDLLMLCSDGLWGMLDHE